MVEKEKPLLRVDVGSPISFKGEIKTEIPKESSGRLLDALTDIIRPFTEARGLKADQIRLQREDVLIEIARRASQRFAAEGRSPRPVPLKFLVPFLEQASVEDPQSEIVELWSRLLVASATDFDAKLIRYSKILAELGPKEVGMLNRICRSSRAKRAELWQIQDVPITFRNYMLQFLIDRQLDRVQRQWKKSGHAPSGTEFSSKIIEEFELPGGLIISSDLGVPVGSQADVLDDWEVNHPEFGLLSEDDRSSISMLESLGLIREEILNARTKYFVASIHVVHFTEFGVGFYLTCNPEIVVEQKKLQERSRSL